MKSTIFALAAAAGSAYAATEAANYGQCGGSNWTGATACASGWTCKVQNPYYSQCVAGSGSAAASSVVASSAASTVKVTSTIAPKTSTLVTKAATKASTSAVASSSSEEACTPEASTSSTSAVASTSAKASTSSKAATSVASTTKVATSVAATTKSSSSSSVSAVSLAVSTTATTATTRASTSSTSAAASSSSTSTGKVKYAGTNISGFDFGCGTDGTCTVSGVEDPSTTGKDQMTHFVTDTGLNAFRLPVAWQYLTNDVVGATLDATNLAAYDTLVQNCISAGAELCIIDIHNYARWNGEIIGQGGPTNAQFSSLWSQLATKYASQTKVAFGIMNEPHDLTSVTTWAATVQAAVTAIRQAGATDNLVLLPGNDWTHASTYISDGSAAALLTVTNIDGSTDNLVFDVHQYLDSDGSGTASTCTTDNVSTFTTLAAWLRTNNRQAMLTETGGGPTDSTCLTNVCAELAYLASNSDVFLGWTGWGAGMFATSYVLSEVPTGTYPNFVDQTLVSQCIAGEFK